MWDMRNAYNVLVGKPERKWQLQKYKHKCDDKIKMYLKEMVSENVDWIHLARDKGQWRALVNTAMYSSSMKGWI
jgi:hypothetical protein